MTRVLDDKGVSETVCKALCINGELMHGSGDYIELLPQFHRRISETTPVSTAEVWYQQRSNPGTHTASESLCLTTFICIFMHDDVNSESLSSP